MNNKAPDILNEVVEALKTANLTAVKDDDEGRVNSKKDEANVIDWLKLQPQFKDRIKSVGLRGFGDAVFIDDFGVDHYVNIKTSKGSYDNAFSKLGFLWAFTDLPFEKMPYRINIKTWISRLIENKKETERDYWFLSLNKDNMNQVMVRGVKQIQNWHCNPTNNLQIIWKKEHESPLKDFSFEESWQNVIINGVFYCWEKQVQQMQQGIQYRKKYNVALTQQPA